VTPAHTTGVRPTRVVIIGASLAGLLTAAAATAAGAQTTIVERDPLPSRPSSRKGVPQDRQAHVLLHRGLLAAEELLPGLRQDLLRHGAVRFDSGDMISFGEYGWLPTGIPAYELVSATRPLLEHLVRERVRRLSELTIRDGLRVTELRHAGNGWRLVCAGTGAAGQPAETTVIEADLVVDASGRGSRLPHWLAALGCPAEEPETVDARLGYACQIYRAVRPTPINVPVVIGATPETARGALAIPVEDSQWLVIAGGYGDRRPDRDLPGFERFLAELPDPAISDLVGLLEPVGEPAIHRQTGNRRHHYGESRDWPRGLLVVGDAYCAFNPVYGQGITVAACQAVLLRDALRRAATAGRVHSIDSRRLQLELASVADLPWAVATGEDLRQPSSDAQQSPTQQLLGRWSAELATLATHGDRTAYRTFAGVYHLMTPPGELFRPALLLAAARARLRGLPPPVRRPGVLDRLTPTGPGVWGVTPHTPRGVPVASAPETRSRGDGLAERPAFRASKSTPTVTALTRTRANTDASGPKVPPVSQAGAPGRAVLTAIEPPRLLPETAAPKR
jgi:2-polyprenyl-6-methoxyphenol hydroxylase-like FAD-dependent oxidoreductase